MNNHVSSSYAQYTGEALKELPGKPWLILKFPDHKRQISKLSHDQKIEWYAHQFELDQRAAVIMGSSKEFKHFWKWNVLIPLKVMRFYYRLKNFEIFKRYDHITEMRKKVKPHSI